MNTERNITGCGFKWIWKAKIPSKIHIFLWQLFQYAVLTRDVMSRRNWTGNPRCSFCSEKKMSQHLFFLCPLARVVWRTVRSVFGTELCPNNIWQFYSWYYSFYLMGANSTVLVSQLYAGPFGTVAMKQSLSLNFLKSLLRWCSLHVYFWIMGQVC